MLPMELRAFAGRLVRGRPQDYFRLWRSGGDYERGMSHWHDLIDWVGGYPFEVATPDEVFRFCAARGLELRRLKTVGGDFGCNEFVFERTSSGAET
jgi:2-polyprenyl-6-hydroxyphenyl methylase/3-demethylubiquinone-9 3-methyltransferase